MFNKHYICTIKLNIKLQMTEKMAKKDYYRRIRAYENRRKQGVSCITLYHSKKYGEYARFQMEQNIQDRNRP